MLRTADAPCSRPRTVLVARPDEPRWTLVDVRWWDRLVTGLRVLELDQALAQGRPPEHSLPHALRAATLVCPARRRALADAWEQVLVRVHRPAARRTSRVPLQQARVRAAAEQIRDLVDALRAPGPVPARGVALASFLLTDGAGPLYDARSRVDLAFAVHEATRLLDPTTDVLDH